MVTDSWCVYSGVFISRGREDALVTKNMVVGESVYGEKRISVEVRLYFTTALWSDGVGSTLILHCDHNCYPLQHCIENYWLHKG